MSEYLWVPAGMSRKAASRAASQRGAPSQRGASTTGAARGQKGAAPSSSEPADLLDAGIARMVLNKAAGHPAAGDAAPDDFARDHSGRFVINQVCDKPQAISFVPPYPFVLNTPFPISPRNTLQEHSFRPCSRGPTLSWSYLTLVHVAFAEWCLGQLVMLLSHGSLP